MNCFELDLGKLQRIIHQIKIIKHLSRPETWHKEMSGMNWNLTLNQRLFLEPARNLNKLKLQKTNSQVRKIFYKSIYTNILQQSTELYQAPILHKEQPETCQFTYGYWSLIQSNNIENNQNPTHYLQKALYSTSVK